MDKKEPKNGVIACIFMLVVENPIVDIFTPRQNSLGLPWIGGVLLLTLFLVSPVSAATDPTANLPLLRQFGILSLSQTQRSQHQTQPPSTTSKVSQIPLKIDSQLRTASLNVPRGIPQVVIEFRSTKSGKAVQSSSQWTTYKTLRIKATPATARISLPADFANKSWRARTVQAAVPAAPKKFPSKFYAGQKSFKAAVAPSYAVQAPQSGGTTSIKTTGVAAGNVATAPLVSDSLNSSASKTATAATVQESDIWKTDGTTAYFFNQLRGLQVIDLSNPSTPSLIASYRLPEKGQDLYIVSGAGTVRYAVLLTSDYDQGQSSTGVKLIKVDGPSATLVAETSISGWMADSRMVGNRLYLATQQWAWSGSAGQDSTTLNEVVVDPSAGTVATGNTHTVTGSWPVISAGSDWLTVAESDWSDWQSTFVTLFSLGDQGATQLTADPIRLFGRLYNKYDVQYSSGVLSTVSQKWVQETNTVPNNWWWNGTQVTTLENFSVDGTQVGSLEIIRGEQLQAARFAGNKAYVVTARQVDPLFVIDLSEATNPVIAGQVEVPGWSTHIEPVGQDKLFTIGYDSNWKVAASLFDVSTASNPALLSRVTMDGSWGYSAATYDDKALKLLPEAGLALIPYSSYNSTNGNSDHYVQLLNLDAAAGTLSLAGTITHSFDPLRASVVGSVIASISQRELVTADITNPAQPIVLADLLLAWTVNRIVASDNYLIQINDGGGWTGEAPTARVSSRDDPDSGLNEIALGDGSVKDAVLNGTTLYVLRQNPVNTGGGWWGGYYPMVRYAGGYGVSGGEGSTPSLFLDVYDASNLPQLSLVGSAVSQLPGCDTAWDISGLLFPSTNSVAVVAQPTVRNYWRWHGPIVYDAPVMMADTAPALTLVAKTGKFSPSCMIPWYGGFAQSTNPATAILFQVSDPTAPVAEAPFPLTEQASSPVKCTVAGSGLLVFGYGDNEIPCQNNLGVSLSTSQHHVRILDLTDPANPFLGPAMDLPGRLIGISDLSSSGFLAWTEAHASGTQIQVSACDGVNISLVNSLALAQDGALATSGYDFFAVQGNAINRYTLDLSGNLNANGSISLDWSPSSLYVASLGANTALLGNDWSHLMNSSWTASGGSILGNWNSDTYSTPDVGLDIMLPDNSILVPENDYGVGQYLSQ